MAILGYSIQSYFILSYIELFRVIFLRLLLTCIKHIYDFYKY